MASWVPSARESRRSSLVPRGNRGRDCHLLRLGRHVVPDRDLLLLAKRLDELEQHLTAPEAGYPGEQQESTAMREAARARLARDLELLSAALERSHAVAH